jgi:hypothetical protein
LEQLRLGHQAPHALFVDHQLVLASEPRGEFAIAIRLSVRGRDELAELLQHLAFRHLRAGGGVPVAAAGSARSRGRGDGGRALEVLTPGIVRGPGHSGQPTH